MRQPCPKEPKEGADGRGALDFALALDLALALAPECDLAFGAATALAPGGEEAEEASPRKSLVFPMGDRNRESFETSAFGETKKPS